MQFRKKAVVIEAHQWFKNGDHPKDYWTPQGLMPPKEGDGDTEGRIVRRFRAPDVLGDTPCKHCEIGMHSHGWVETLEGGHIVCPGDWIITGIKGEMYPCKADVFELTYDTLDADSAGGELTPKTLHNSDASGARLNVSDIKIVGTGDEWFLLCKASSQKEGWMKSTKAMPLAHGALVQVTTQQKNPDGGYAIAEALTFVPGVTVSRMYNDGTEMEHGGRRLALAGM